MAKKQKFYVVWEGRRLGVYDNWDECKKQIDGFTGAKFKSFETLKAAQEAFDNEYEMYAGKTTKNVLSEIEKKENGYPMFQAICVDAACNVSTGVLEYKGVTIPDNKIIFLEGPFAEGTNNIGEYLAIVHALSYCKKNNLDIPIFSDSLTALVWLKNKQTKTTLQPSKKNNLLFIYLEKANKWLHTNTYPNKILKWETDLWGENPADFGRK